MGDALASSHGGVRDGDAALACLGKRGLLEALAVASWASLSLLDEEDEDGESSSMVFEAMGSAASFVRLEALLGPEVSSGSSFVSTLLPQLKLFAQIASGSNP